ncbi:TPA: alpha/beta hydrolase [Pseudomonas aeruginosa]|uniref:alpha/beta hydrolase n=1 Tax=Pseudomonas aeruginosa TaxID=287 RepID=UPI002A086697|nr:lysophospholipase [Pseudomonas aeruginosa]
MSSLTWIRGFNGTIGRIAPRWTAERMRRTFMVPGEWPPKDWELPLLASSERVTLRFGLSVLRWGEGPAVLLLHGWAGRPTQFAHLIEQLVGAGYSVYALDAPAHGRSPGREANVVLFAHALLEAAGELPPLRAVVGHSLGGAAALLAAQMGLRSEALVTVSAPSRILEQLRLFARFVGLPALARSHFIRLVERQAIRGVPGCGALPSGNARTGGACRRRHARSGGKCRAHPCRLAGQSLAAPAGRRPPPTARRAQAERVAAGAARGAPGDARLPARGKDGERFLRRVAEGLSLS